MEGVKDKYLYEGAINGDHLLDDASSIIVPCHANYRIHEFLPISKELNIRAAVITDFDTLKHKRKDIYVLHQIIDNLVKDAVVANSLKTAHLQVYEKIKGIDYIETQGMNAIEDQELRQEVLSLIVTLKAVGLFVVPIGALEAWFQTTKETEVEELLPRYKFATKKKYVELRSFLRELTEYLLKQQ